MNISKEEHSYISDLLKARDLKKKILFFNINSKKTIYLICLQKDLNISNLESLGAKFFGLINDNKQNDYLINLASVEYFKSINIDNLKSKLINVSFKEKRDGKYKIIAIYSKRARGLMSRFIIKNKIIDPKSLKKFNLEDYKFNKTLSSDSDLVFTR